MADFEPNLILDEYAFLTELELGGWSKFSRGFRARDAQGNYYILELIPKKRRGMDLLLGLRQKTILNCFDIKQADNGSWIQIFEYFPGQTLRDLIDGGEEFSSLDIAIICIQICNGLSSIHELKLIHEDLRPENILINSQGELKIKGILIPEVMVNYSNIPEIWNYVAPEQVSKSVWITPGASANAYSLASILYELLTKRKYGKSIREIHDGIKEAKDPLLALRNQLERFPEPRLTQDLPEEFAIIISKSLQVDSDTRLDIKDINDILTSFINKSLSDGQVEEEVSEEVPSGEASEEEVSEEIFSDEISEGDISEEVPSGKAPEEDISEEVPSGKAPEEDISEEISSDEISEEEVSEEVPSDEISEEEVSEEIPSDKTSEGDISGEISSDKISEEYIAEEIPSDKISEEYIAEEISSDKTSEEEVSEEISSDEISEEEVSEEIPSDKISEEYIAEEIPSDKISEEYIAEEIPSGKISEEYIAEEISSGKISEEDISEEISSDKISEEYIAEEIPSDKISEEYIAEEISSGKISEEYIAEKISSGKISEEYIAEEISSGKISEEYIAEEPPEIYYSSEKKAGMVSGQQHDNTVMQEFIPGISGDFFSEGTYEKEVIYKDSTTEIPGEERPFQMPSKEIAALSQVVDYIEHRIESDHIKEISGKLDYVTQELKDFKNNTFQIINGLNKIIDKEEDNFKDTLIANETERVKKSLSRLFSMVDILAGKMVYTDWPSTKGLLDASIDRDSSRTITENTIMNLMKINNSLERALAVLSDFQLKLEEKERQNLPEEHIKERFLESLYMLLKQQYDIEGFNIKHLRDLEKILYDKSEFFKVMDSLRNFNFLLKNQ